jgi:type IV pilus assembly protein PilV
MNRQRSSGFTLLEVLVSIVVLAIGLLGMAGLIAAGLKSNHTANYRAHATMLTDDILDRMRANKTLALASGYDTTLGAACTASVSTIQGFDCAEWKAMVANELPGGDGAVDVDVNGNITVTIQWNSGLDENQDGTVNASDALSFITKTRL